MIRSVLFPPRLRVARPRNAGSGTAGSGDFGPAWRALITAVVAAGLSAGTGWARDAGPSDLSTPMRQAQAPASPEEEAEKRAAALARAENAAFAGWATEVSNINRALLGIIRTTEAILDVAAQASSGQSSRQIAAQIKDQLASSARAQLKDLRSHLDRRFPDPRFANPTYIEQVDQARDYLMTTIGKMGGIITETENTFYAAINRGAAIDIDAQPATLLATATEFEAQTFELRQLAALRGDNPLEGFVLRAQIEANQAVATAMVAIAESARVGSRSKEAQMDDLFAARELAGAAQAEVELGLEALESARHGQATPDRREKTRVRRLRTELMQKYGKSLALAADAIGLVDDFIRRVGSIGIPLSDDPFFGQMRQIAGHQRMLTTERNKLTNDIIKARLPKKRPKPVFRLPDGTVLNPS